MILDIELVEEEAIELNLELGTLIGDDARDHYEGPYEATPKKNDIQTLETNDKIMDNDLTVLEIPYSEVDNPEGGKTINIAFEL